MKKIKKRLNVGIDTIRNLSLDDLKHTVGGECPTYARNCTYGLCPGSVNEVTCMSIFQSECTMCP